MVSTPFWHRHQVYNKLVYQASFLWEIKEHRVAIGFHDWEATGVCPHYEIITCLEVWVRYYGY